MCVMQLTHFFDIFPNLLSMNIRWSRLTPLVIVIGTHTFLYSLFILTQLKKKQHHKQTKLS